jgi:acetate kinase
MDVLTLDPGLRELPFAYLSGDLREDPVVQSRLDIDQRRPHGEAALDAVRAVRGVCPVVPRVVAVRAVHGGDVLDGPTVATPDVLDSLGDAVACAPMHLPALLSVTRACFEVFPEATVVVVPETAFFNDLPLREQIYGLSTETRRALGVRRFGFHGLLHRAACEFVAAQRSGGGRREPARVLSLCLERRPELAAVRGMRPLMVTSGATPLEGLPGETHCGELDPGIVLQLVKHTGLAPEQIDVLLTRESGLRGLAGANLSVGEVLSRATPETRLAREVFEYRTLLACGSGVAALGGLDAIALCGRYARNAPALGASVRQRLALALGLRASDVQLVTLEASLEQTLARAAVDCARRAARSRAYPPARSVEALGMPRSW